MVDVCAAGPRRYGVTVDERGYDQDALYDQFQAPGPRLELAGIEELLTIGHLNDVRALL